MSDLDHAHVAHLVGNDRAGAEFTRIAAEMEATRAALADTLRMLQAAHMQLGMDHKGNKRVMKARAVLAKASATGGADGDR